MTVAAFASLGLISACSSKDDEAGASTRDRVEQSAESGASRAVAEQSAQSADVVMSGEFVVGPNGKLLQPVDPELEKPTLPEAGKARTMNGAEAFGRYFVEVYAYSWNSGKTGLMESISAPECDFCTDTIRRINKATRMAIGSAA